MSESAFRSSVRSAVRGLWSNSLSQSQFKSALSSAISRHLQTAWSEGAKECGIAVDELSEEETKARDAFIDEQKSFVSDFGDAIRGSDKIGKGKLQPLFGRAEMWVNRYADARNRAKTLACGDSKLLWTVGPTEHCRDCLKYNGRVYRASMWTKYEIRPQSSRLACHGFRCQCQLSKTDKQLTKGVPPRMTG